MADDTQPQRRKPPAAGRGRRKGELNKITRDLRLMISQALENAGGVDYLTNQACKNPVAFLALVGKTLPRDIRVEQTITRLSYAERIAAEAVPSADAAEPSTADTIQ